MILTKDGHCKMAYPRRPRLGPQYMLRFSNVLSTSPSWRINKLYGIVLQFVFSLQVSLKNQSTLVAAQEICIQKLSYVLCGFGNNHEHYRLLKQR